MTEKRQRTTVVSTRLTAAELETIQQAALGREVPVSQYMRDATLREELRSRPGTRIVCGQAGEEILVWTNRWDLVSVV